MSRLSMDKVIFEISTSGFEYSSGEYKNLDSLLNVKCPKNHTVVFSLKQLRTGKQKCPVCEEYDSISTQETELINPKKIKKTGIRVIALDQATEKTGYAIFEDGNLLDYGIKQIETSKETGERITELRHWLVSMMYQWDINYLGLENIHYQGNPQTLISLGRLLGALEATGADMLDGNVIIVPPGTWRNYCKIKGNKRNQQKEGAQDFVKQKYKISVSQDAADAICLGEYLSNRAAEESRFDKEIKWG